MNRRGFLKLLGTTVPAIVAAPALAELLASTRTIILPPRGGWPVDMSRYFASRQAWYIMPKEGGPRNELGVTGLTEESLERMLIEIKQVCDSRGQRIRFQPTRAFYGSSGK